MYHNRFPRKKAYFSSFIFLGLFQYGDLHLGQTDGSTPSSRGTHWWEHRSHLKPLIMIIAMKDTIHLIIIPCKYITTLTLRRYTPNGNIYLLSTYMDVLCRNILNRQALGRPTYRYRAGFEIRSNGEFGCAAEVPFNFQKEKMHKYQTITANRKNIIDCMLTHMSHTWINYAPQDMPHKGPCGVINFRPFL